MSVDGELLEAGTDAMSARAVDGELLEAGTSVVISALRARPELNGTIGSILGFDEGKARYKVKLPSTEKILLKAANVQAAADQHHHRASPTGRHSHTPHPHTHTREAARTKPAPVPRNIQTKCTQLTLLPRRT